MAYCALQKERKKRWRIDRRIALELPLQSSKHTAEIDWLLRFMPRGTSPLSFSTDLRHVMSCPRFAHFYCPPVYIQFWVATRYITRFGAHNLEEDRVECISATQCISCTNHDETDILNFQGTHPPDTSNVILISHNFKDYNKYFSLLFFHIISDFKILN